MINEIEQGIEKFRDYYPFEADFELQILKGHLLVEEDIRYLIQLQLYNPDALRGSNGVSFDCLQAICLAEALTIEGQTCEWVWVAAKKLNNLRNDLAHRLVPKGRDHKLQDFTSYVLKNCKTTTQLVEKRGKEQTLTLCIMALHSTLSTIKSIVVLRMKNT